VPGRNDIKKVMIIGSGPIAAKGIAAYRNGKVKVKFLQNYHADIQ
jgi:hypothetical protein